jgi:beta-lactamase class A
MLKERYAATKSWVVRNPRRFVGYSLGTILVLLLLFQIFYPANSLAPFSSIEGVSLGGVSKEEAIKKLDNAFNTSKVAVYFQDNSQLAFLKATPGDLGITSSNQQRIQGIDYPWFARLIPSSILWIHIFTDNSVAPLQYQRNQDTLASFMTTKFNGTCHLDPQNATVAVKDTDLQVVEAFAGGDCDLGQLTDQLASVKPTIQGATLTIPGTATAPAVTTANAQTLADHIAVILKDGIAVNDGKDLHSIPKELLYSWLDFAVTDGKLDYSFNADRAASYLGERIASVVEKPTGVMTITMRDFAETSRDPGQSGVVFNEVAMLNSIKASLEKGEKKVAVEVTTIPPSVKYTYSYSPDDPALTNLIKQYANTHPGTYGVSLHEISGKRRNASYQGSTQYTTASTYKLFVAYSTLLRIESGAWHWSDQVNGGRDLTKCFDDMIELSDNDCAVALLKRIGYQAITDEAHAMGAVNTSFLVSDDIKSTPEDESLLLALLATGQILTQQSSRDIWINAMKEDVYQQGIPAGVPSLVVANKVGFLDDWLNDAGIIYSPAGTYVLVIMTQDASWGNIAGLTSQIETLRTN